MRAGRGFGHQTVQNVVIAGADRRNDVLLIAKGGVLTGHVRGYAGVPLAGVTVHAQDPATGATIASVTSDDRGAYQMNLGGGTYRFYLQAPYPRPAGAPNGSWYTYLYDQVITGTTTFDFGLPVVQVRGIVSGSNGAPVEGATVSSSGHNTEGAWYTYGHSSAVTDSGGRYELFAFLRPNHSFVVTAPAPLGTLIQNLALDGDTTRDFVVSEAPLVSGHVRGYGGTTLAGVAVHAQDPAAGTTIASVTSDAEGAYQMNLGVGTYGFYLNPPHLSISRSRRFKVSLPTPTARPWEESQWSLRATTAWALGTRTAIRAPSRRVQHHRALERRRERRFHSVRHPRFGQGRPR